MTRKVTAALVLGGMVAALVTVSTVAAQTVVFRPPNLSGLSVRVIATEVGMDQMPLFYAEDLLRRWGATVTHTEAGSTTIAVAGASTGQADVVQVSPLAGLSGVVNGLGLKAFAMSAVRTDDVFVSKPAITSLQQVKGTAVGVLSVNSVNGVELGLALGRGGLKISDVSVIAAGGQSVRVGAFLSGRLDAGPISLDNYKSTLRQAGFRVLYNYMTQSPGLTKGLLWAKPDWLDTNKKLALAFNEAILLSFRWMNDPKNKNAFVQLATSKMKGLEPAVAAEAFDDYKRYGAFPPNAIMTKINLAGNMSSFVQYNLVPKTLPVDQWADTSFAKQALAAVGKVAKANKK